MKVEEVNFAGWIRRFEGIYKITSDGKVYSYRYSPPKLLSAHITKKGASVQLWKQVEVSPGVKQPYKEKIFVHRLLWETFRGERLSKYDQIIHIDGNRLNNRITNLRKANKTESKLLNGRDLTNIKVIETITGNERVFDNLQEIAMFYGVNQKTLRKALKTGEEIEIVEKTEL